MLKYIISLLMILSVFCAFALEWPTAIPLRQGANIEWFRTGAETSDGGLIYVWSDTKLGARDLYAQKVNASGNMVWGQPLLVDGKPDRQEDPVIKKTSDGNFIIAWIDFSDDLDGSVYAQKISTSGQLLWQNGGVPVCVYPGIQISLNIEPDNAGGAYIIWVDSRNPGKDIYGQRLSSTGSPLWTLNGVPIANSAGDETQNTMWADGTGGLIICYVHSIAGTESLFVKRFLPNGQMAWTQPLALSPHSAIKNNVKMAPINSDSFVFTWMDFRNLDPDIYAQRVNLNGTPLWPEPFVVFSDSAAVNSAPQENPRIVQTSDNGVIIVWEDKRNDQDNPDLFAQKINLTGQRLWNLNGVPVAVAEFGQKGPRLSADNNGGSFIVWDDARNGNVPNIDIYAQHLSSAGVALWQQNGLLICNAPNEQSGSLVKFSGNNVFINWMDMRSGSVGIYYQVLNSSGAALLAGNGVQVFWGLSGDAVQYSIIHLPRQDDTVVVWQDTRFANIGAQIFFQVINSGGSVDFEVNGRPVTTLTGFDQSNPTAIVLPDNKIAIAWEEQRTANPKVYAQLIDANGNRLWGDMGIPLTENEPLNQKDTKISYVDGALYFGWSSLDNVTTPVGDVLLFRIHGQRIVGNQKMWGPNGILISQVPADPLFECQMGALVERCFIWTRTSTNLDNAGEMNVLAKRMNPNGTTATGWSDYGIATASYAGFDQMHMPEAALTNQGIFVSWLDFRGDFMKNYFGQLLSWTGQILWDPSGVALADHGREQAEMSVLGGNDITFTWKEVVTQENPDIALHRYNLSGQPQWGNWGLFIVQRDSIQASPDLVRFNNGGMAVVWEDYINEVNRDIFLRFIESDGTLIGPPNGIVICDELMIQKHPLISVLRNETPNEAVIVWSDGRSSGKTPIFGLYAQKVTNATTSAYDENEHISLNKMFLSKNYPNPFNPETHISFNLKKNMQNVELAIYNTKGQKIKVLHSGITEKGNYNYVWNGLDERNKPVSSGVYFYRLSSEHDSITRKMILLK